MNVATYAQFTFSDGEFLSPSNANCACPNERLIFNCTAIGGEATTWGGSAFDCQGNQNEIILLHNSYSGQGALGECNGGTISGWSVGVDEKMSYFTSQLNVTVSDELNNKTVTCSVSSNSVMSPIGGSQLKVAGMS